MELESACVALVWNRVASDQSNLDSFAAAVACSIRRDSRRQLLEASVYLDTCYDDERDSAPALYLHALATVLEAAAAATSAEATTALGLPAHRVLEALVERGGSSPRAEIRRTSELSESHLSHVLRELEHFGLVERTRQGKEVTIDLTPRGYAIYVQIPDANALSAQLRALVEATQVAETDHLSEHLPDALGRAHELSAVALTRVLNAQLEELGVTRRPVTRSRVFFGEPVDQQ
jgi:DNA-binding MarR family transcriptional regulator